MTTVGWGLEVAATLLFNILGISTKCMRSGGSCQLGTSSPASWTPATFPPRTTMSSARVPNRTSQPRDVRWSLQGRCRLSTRWVTGASCAVHSCARDSRVAQWDRRLVWYIRPGRQLCRDSTIPCGQPSAVHNSITMQLGRATWIERGRPHRKALRMRTSLSVPR